MRSNLIMSLRLFFLISFAFLSGCASFDSGNVDKELGSLIPKEAALKIVNERLKLSDDLRLDARGVGGQACSRMSKPGLVKDIRMVMYQTYSSGHRILWISLDHPSNSMFCGSGVFVSGLSEDKVVPFVTSLKSLGAPIDKFQIVRHKLDCHGCGPVQ